ncbi:type I-E CRISPR-associated protein Cse2/CasB [Cronobacter sakazakii]|uniref:type I-E CRISPR-associated protein Cse2/CasB n=1 Tax=Cronobacter sakazakii TaxID=28141 RepID=UPI000976AD06|nr:type I-E CRISPR-associated protein Cse2/CasB [Cronobacter sakazakii]EME1928203.1 type I-E CRISPR-associated protein Cse2/CasB [Cronobacter sakazakii]EME1933239.1 type I-E CRISPR-associated protein Cse2/CasB [Cronobacter sakazakii]EME1942819.1 type I-E CRISPR-associated protein Cse2/CasB [Cronobacter sakazakii]
MSILSQAHRESLLKWHALMNEQQGRRLRASLRRSHTLNEVRLSEGFNSLAARVPTLWNVPGREWRFCALGIVAALAAHIKTVDTCASFAEQLGHKEGNHAVMSELRFRRLSQARTQEELFRQLRRAVQLLGGVVNLPDLAEGVFRWCAEENERERRAARRRAPTDYIRVRWALDYYMAGNPSDAPDAENTDLPADSATTQE